jgi:hypothetical protein
MILLHEKHSERGDPRRCRWRGCTMYSLRFIRLRTETVVARAIASLIFMKAGRFRS